MTLHYVYVVWRRLSHEQGTNWGRFMLTFESRYVADEFYMAMATLRRSDGSPRFVTFSRAGAQLWTFDSNAEPQDPWWALMYVHLSGILKPFKERMIHTYLSDGNHSQRFDWPVIAIPAEGPDWVDGGAFFVRNKRQRTRYWFCAPDGSIHVSTTHQTKFRIRRAAGTSGQASTLAAGDLKQILIRKDMVTVQAIGSLFYVSIPASGRLAQTAALVTWSFGRFFAGLGARWEADSAGVERLYVVGTNEDEGDEWELC
ncbi:hypothetical protein P154DRAFT_602891 [Amniculicola lignicola CBS 123094]|uniref:Uncharacterized protein n=1 Tax=Amniculicola lignicola CBS 123094 TaxID=1392246 RepID=A0A6A5W977_9PLEO|nr:hypothetical protein P154DRAFT_602891 [Amniculicola lignicola CBS 123094]